MTAKGYWVAHVDVTDAEAYKAYQAAVAEVFQEFGGRFVVRGGRSTVMEGKFRSRAVVVEFADYDTALRAYNSPAYARAKALRQPVSQADLMVVEGYAPA